VKQGTLKLNHSVANFEYPMFTYLPHVIKKQATFIFTITLATVEQYLIFA